MSRTTTILALLQTLLIIIGFFALGAVLKLNGYPDASIVRWNPLAVFLREHGIWLIFFPVLWVFYATVAQRRDRGFFVCRDAHIVGVCATFLIITLFLFATVDPYTRPLIIYRAKPNVSPPQESSQELKR